MLIENGTVFTGGKFAEVLPGHSVLVNDGLISMIAPKRQLHRPAGKRIDASGKAVLPGFINAHTHLYSTFARGITKTKASANFNEVLRNLWWRLDSALTTEACYYSALIGLLDSIRHGTTTIIDHHASPNAVRGSLRAIENAVRQTGLRACLCYELTDRDGAQIAKAGLEENAAFIRRCRRQNHISNGSPLQVTALFGLHACFTLNDSSLEKAAALGHELGTGFHIHVAESASDQEFALKHHRMRVVERLDRFTILGPQTIAAHGVHLSRREMDLLARTGTMVVHNPQSNSNNAVGVADIGGLAKHGVVVGLGTDAMTTSMLEELRAALWTQRLQRRNPSAWEDILATLFGNNAEIAERIFYQELGVLQVGSPADIVLVDYDPPTPWTNENAFGHIVFGLSQAPVDTTIVAGRVLMQNRKLRLDLDEKRINARAREVTKNLWKKL